MKRNYYIIICAICFFVLYFSINSEAAEAASFIVNATEVSLYALDDGYADKITIPENYAGEFQLTVSGTSQKPSYFVSEGESVEVSEDGKITPATTTWYWNGNVGSTVSSGAEDEIAVVSHNFGKSVIGVRIGEETCYVTVTVYNYANVYADEVMKQYIQDNITENMTDLEKLDKIAAFPAQYDYDGHYSGYVSMIVFGGGDCWASSYAILRLCEMTGLEAHLRYGANDGGAGSGHRNVAVKIGDAVYVAEAGYSEPAPRYYSVMPENTGFCYYVSQGKATIIQYDGFEKQIEVPSEINGFPVAAIGKSAFSYGERYSGVSIESVLLPNTIETIGESAFNSCESLKTITIPASVSEIGDLAFTNCAALDSILVSDGNAKYQDINGVLYNKELTTLLSYPAGRKGAYYVPEGVEEIADYAFYYTRGVKKVVFPNGIKRIGVGAFGDSKVSRMYFAGDMPQMELYALRYLNLTLYYPKENMTWNVEDDFGAFAIDWKGYEGSLADLNPKGDVIGNGDGVNLMDVEYVLRIALGIVRQDSLTIEQQEAADVVGNGNGIDLNDARAILRRVLRIPVTFDGE